MTISAQNISISIGDIPIIDDISFTAQPGKVTSIVGPNGSGKTTFLRALTGEIAFQGKIRLNGLDIADLSYADLALMRAVLPQASNLSFPFTVREVVEMGVRAGPYADRTDIIQCALEKVGLSNMSSRYYQELSGGEKQRVQLARILSQIWEPVVDEAPRWLFLDEPVSSLDVGHQLEVMKLARAFANAGGGVVAIMHDLNLTAGYSDEIALFAKGRLFTQGTVRDVLTNHNLSFAYSCNIEVDAVPDSAIPFILPQMVS